MLATGIIPREHQNLPDEYNWMMMMRRHAAEALGHQHEHIWANKHGKIVRYLQ
jgi:hypothetical protein